MAKGELALVLHAHLPYVRSSEPGSLEEDWFFQALMECYLPLLQILEDSKKQNPKITIGISPTLVSLFIDKELKERFPNWLKIRIKVLEEINDERKVAANHLSSKIKFQLQDWNNCKGDLITRFSNLQKLKIVDILTCAATHGYLPLLREKPEVIRGQLNTAVMEHERVFGIKPLGIWLPECAYYEGLDELISQAGLRYAILDGHGLLHAKPRPRYGLYAPICTKQSVAFFGRDSDSTLPIWSARDGYPGNPEYREFHRDLGWDIPIENLKKRGIKESRPLGLKLNKITNRNIPLDKKKVYEPQKALQKTQEHARDYLRKRSLQINKLSSSMDISPLLVAPFDAELFGHWWFEGPSFLSELFTQAKNEGISFTTLSDYLSNRNSMQLCCPSPSSWGQGGYHDYWLNDKNSWVVMEWSKAGEAMIEKSNSSINTKSELKILQQAARELLLLQSSDWSFILRAGTTTDLAKERINRHLNRFWTLINSLEKNITKNENMLEMIESEDRLFPSINVKDWATK